MTGTKGCIVWVGDIDWDQIVDLRVWVRRTVTRVIEKANRVLALRAHVQRRSA